jgi:hypothetical protein
VARERTRGGPLTLRAARASAVLPEPPVEFRDAVLEHLVRLGE